MRGAPGLVGRDAELSRLADLLAQAGSGGTVAAVIRGEAGSGKTTLLRTVADRARTDGWTCVAVSGIESEAVLSGAGLLAALTPLRRDLDSVPAVQADVLAAALGWGPTSGVGDRFLIGAATLSLLAAAAARAPLLLAVDDAQWVDAQSMEALAFAARRLGHDRFVMLVTHRIGTPLPVPLDGFDVVAVAGLMPDAARELLGPGFSATVVERLVSETGGNPLALRECLHALNQAQRAGAAALPQALPVPDRLNELYAVELGRLSPSAWRAVVLCAASTDEAAAPMLAALVSEGLDPDECLAGTAQVLVVQDGRCTFRHPLLRSAAWARATVIERQAAHRSLAAVTLDQAARAWHRAEATPGHDNALAEELARVADVDRSRRGFAAASGAIERAARLTADPGRRADWLAVAAEDAHLAGDADRVRRLAAEVLRSDAGAESRARVLLTLGMLEVWYGTFARARDLLEQAAELATGLQLIRTLSELFHICYLLDDIAGMVAAADRAASGADGTEPEQAMLAAYLPGAARVVEGRPDLGAPLIHQALELLETDPVLRDDPRHLSVLLLCARWLMDPQTVAAFIDRRIARAREAGALGLLAMGLSLYSGGLAWLGDHVRAHAFAGEAVELLEILGYTADPGVAYEIAAIESAARGMHDDAQQLLDQARRMVAINGFDPMPPHLARTVAFCATCRGDLDEVADVLEDQVVRFDGIGLYLEPLGVAPLLVEAYLGLGRDADAQALVARFAAAQALEPIPPVAAMLARCEALVADTLDDAVPAFERALALLGDQPDQFEPARTRLLYGMRLRRGGRRVDARVQLEAARRAFVEMELTLWAERAAHELAGTGERVHSRDATREPLTSQETRVALLVAQGMRNREVAAALFLSPKTVEHHLGAVLRKRGLRSRTELARALATET
ncbi:putative ATPase [Kribbella sp. VKM Ac-2527]|uniref:Putative ATPase n=2 Tax=Kribbella caucasensis TaxID=2512215 RepID=A0A4R6K6G7_9ACTN|nr:putative ATPase [Kribbella sp. VKM Ac-2527]